MKKYLYYLIIFCSLFIFYFLLIFYFDNKLSSFDIYTYNFIIYLKSTPMTLIMNFLSLLCHYSILILIIIIFFLITKNLNYFKYMTLNLILSNTINSLVKIIVKRPRPININLIEESGFSFPSGHAMSSITFYGLLIFIICSSNIDKKYKYIFCALLSLLIILIGVSRIYLGVHYTSDVFAGFTLGLSYLLVFIKLFKEKINE